MLEISQLTDAIRQDRKEHGELGVGHSFDRYVSLQWTTAQNTGNFKLQDKQILQFHRDTNLQNDMSRWKSCALALNLWYAKDRFEVNISPKQTRAFSVYERQAIRCPWQQPHDVDSKPAKGRNSGRPTGSWSKVTSLDGGAIRLEDGRAPSCELSRIHSRICSHHPSKPGQNRRYRDHLGRRHEKGTVLCRRQPRPERDRCRHQRPRATS